MITKNLEVARAAYFAIQRTNVPDKSSYLNQKFVFFGGKLENYVLLIKVTICWINAS